jgi:predicted glycosyltransferase
MRLRKRIGDIWPIMPGSERPPENWRGWPEGKKFAFVLTHDVESKEGLSKCRGLMKLEQNLGFRSSFNFIPEGSYRVPSELRNELTASGFEVGIHDLKHNGHLFASRRKFKRSAAKINGYAREWGASGFRSGFMLRNLDWLHELDMQYDASTFDTDPFEPQPHGRHTIFPFWVPCPNGNGSGLPASSEGYVELPYTLCQDSTLFLMLRETTPEIWMRKLDWIAEHGGMVLLDTHPDYMSMESERSTHVYPVSFYSDLLEYIRSKYEGTYWHALPRDVARQVRAANVAKPERVANLLRRNGRIAKQRAKIWIDLDNTPHVPFFEPIVDELRSRGFPVLLTARDAFQVCELADKKGLRYAKIGRHYGKNAAMKAAGLIYRSLQLAPTVLREKPALGVSHGARSQLFLSNCLHIPTILIEDYEYSEFPVTMRPSWIMAPSVIPDAALPCRNGHVRKYEGIKEDVYAWKLRPDATLLQELGLSASDIIVTVRPPATEAHYHNPEAERLFERFMQRVCRTASVKVVLVPRNQKQASYLRRQWPEWFKDSRVVIPQGAVDGLNLLWHSDLVVSGGGTMNREAAALGVPVYSIFRGTIGAVDHRLNAEARLVLIESVDDVETKIDLSKRPRKAIAETTSRRTLLQIVNTIEEIAESRQR